MQSDIATRVAEALGIVLGAGEEKQLGERPTQNLAAYDEFLKGEEASNSMGTVDPIKLRPALGFYERAVALDPDFAQAWAQLARANAYLYMTSTPTPALAERARQAAARAVALAPNLSAGYLARGDYQGYVVGDFNRAAEEYGEGRRRAPGNAELVAASVQVNESLGRWEGAIDHLKQAERLDPRSVSTKLWLGTAFIYLRRYPEAREAASRGLALAPANLTLIQQKALTFLVQGRLAEAQAVLRATPREVEPTALVAYVATNQDLVWVLDDEQRELLLRLTPNAFDDNKGVWGLCLAQAYALKGDAASASAHAAEARQAYEEQLRASPQDAQRHVLLGVALAYLGQRVDAMRAGERAAALRPVTKDAYFGPIIQRQLVRIYVLVGEPEKALDRLEPLLRIPGLLSPGWLRIDPTFDPLRKNPRFQKLVAGRR